MSSSPNGQMSAEDRDFHLIREYLADLSGAALQKLRECHDGALRARLLKVGAKDGEASRIIDRVWVMFQRERPASLLEVRSLHTWLFSHVKKTASPLNPRPRGPKKKRDSQTGDNSAWHHY